MKKYRNGKLVDMTEAEVARIVTFRERAAVDRQAREAKEAEDARRLLALNELIDEKLKAR